MKKVESNDQCTSIVEIDTNRSKQSTRNTNSNYTTRLT